jgi:phosphoglycolate phosphatase-like HAD superfamily hydrolase
VISSGFQWDAADAYLFDIDGTLLNSRDAVHYFAFIHAAQQVLGVEVGMEGVPVHGRTDVGIVRDILKRRGVPDATVDAHLSRIFRAMCAEVERNREELRPEVCPAIPQLIDHLRARGKLLGAASGNLECIGWLKLEKAGLKEKFAFGSFSWPRETRAEIFEHGVMLARQRLGSAAAVCVIGDTPSDIQAARAAGIPVIALATGIFSWDELRSCGPDACLSCAADLLSLPRLTS